MCKLSLPLCFVIYLFRHMFVLKKNHNLLSRDVLLWKARLPIELESNITHSQQMPLPDPWCRTREKVFKYEVPGPVSKSVLQLDCKWYPTEIPMKLCNKVYLQAGLYMLTYIFIIKCYIQPSVILNYVCACMCIYIKINSRVPSRGLDSLWAVLQCISATHRILMTLQYAGKEERHVGYHVEPR